ncbi:type II toxin-antitoxin system PemK/MazF family toxin [Campylobacter coli]|uniref:type II toxin-antitoxin system PemK/MazF family toxin n=1 Tax=Campylobacter coli TaxID=195 RepID=UPI000258212F|nr:type II toxin-antitoxin system PemK/MazF family toxin [Campylobacter coli]EAJ0945902.1 type II toxin-antitoxin system PemK/MazF family toxin [Campylobacter jejuni]EAJ0416656.1 type II toxin-antitoxin system PemK/MazF family toxin [Campylobacter coli]EAL9425844.1 type II toxin-antitoxin system PemK/MazF family toxin [Campylobacter coli]EDO6638177.1 type II toxin-antitoxin system PemK/MazF family toxin [Campylobacter coli]EEP3612516.1 type II toxin-antitoxin system PemK/MazF family toxin [Cam
MVSSKIVKYGELWIADFEPQVGEEITKKRPALILSNNLFNSNQKLVFVVPLTTWQDKFYKGIWFLKIDKNATNNLNVDSAINCSQVKSFSKDRLIEKIGEVDEKIMKEVRIILDEILSPQFNS